VFSHRSHRRIISEPRWRPSRQYTTATLSPENRPWLLDDSSLTLRLSRMNQGDFRVRRLWQGWQVPLLSENNLLASPARQVALVREVALMLDHRPVVFARSVFPIASLTGDLAHLRYLKNKSLGAILFRHPGMHRSPFELALMEGGSDYLPEELRQEEPAWGRRSRFVIGGRSLLVSEVFLRSFSPWTTALAVHRAQRGKVDAAIVRPSQ
jgi:chorismate--pyruvate lyase